MATITTTTPPENLTGWTVTVPAGWYAPSDYGQFKLNISSSESVFYLFVGYIFNEDFLSARRFDDYVYFGDAGDFPLYDYTPDQDISFKVVGGDDVSNSLLIQWLVNNNATFSKEEEDTQVDKTNNLPAFLKDLYEGIITKKPDASKNPQNFRAEIESIADVPEWDGSFTKVTDLKGTTWELSGGFEAEAGLGQFAVDCTYNGKTYNRLGIGYGWEASLETVFPFANWALLYNEGTTEYAKMTGGTYVFSITGGNDVGNSVLKDWLFKYGKLLNRIIFTIDGATYLAKSGMTWAEWVESDYNTDGYEVSGDGIYSADSMNVATEDSVIVGSNDEIIANETYLLISHVGGGA